MFKTIVDYLLVVTHWWDLWNEITSCL